MSLDQRFDRRLVEIADRNHGHQLGTVPVLVKLLQPLVLETLDHFHVADRQAFRVTRSLEQNWKLLVLHSRAGAATEPPLFRDHAPLLVDLIRFERHVVRPVLEDQERFVEHLRLVGRHFEHIDGFIEARKGVDARPEPHPDRLQELHRFLLGKMRGAVEGHVLDEMRQPRLVAVFEDRSGIDDQPERGALFWFLVRADVVPQPVGELSRRDLRIDGDLRRHRRGCGPGRKGGLRRRGRGRLLCDEGRGGQAGDGGGGHQLQRSFHILLQGGRG